MKIQIQTQIQIQNNLHFAENPAVDLQNKLKYKELRQSILMYIYACYSLPCDGRRFFTISLRF